MIIDNLNNVHLTDQQMNAVNHALTSLETALNLVKKTLQKTKQAYGVAQRPPNHLCDDKKDLCDALEHLVGYSED